MRNRRKPDLPFPFKEKGTPKNQVWNQVWGKFEINH